MDLTVLNKKIEQAFNGVPRGRVSVREASALDDRVEEPQLSRFRKSDVETDWKFIPDDVLTAD